MCKFVSFLFAAGLLLTAQNIRADTGSEFMKAFALWESGDAFEKGGEKEKAVEKYSSALKIFRQIKKNAPDWNSRVIDMRIEYCTEKIIKNGGKVEAEEVITRPIEKPPSDPINTVPSGAVPVAAPTPPTSSPGPDNPSAERIANLERDLQQARDDLRKVQGEKSDLETRLKKAEDELKSAGSSGDERVQALLKENNSLKQKLSDAETMLKSIPSGSEDIMALKAELIKTQAALEAAKKENEDLHAANENLKKDLEDTRNQLKTATSGPASSLAPEVLQTLKMENALLRSIVDRQFEEDAKRIAARDILSAELKDLSSRSEAIRTKLEILQTPLTPLTEEERQLLKTPGAVLRGDDPTKLSGVVTAKRSDGSRGDPAAKLTGDNAVLASEARQLFAKGDMNAAATKYEQILQNEPNNLFALSNLGVVRFRQDRIDEAEKNLHAALAIDPRDAFSISILGIVNYRQGKFDEALSTLTKAIAINPDNHETHNYLGITYSQKGYQEAAEKELLKAIELQPEYGDAHFNLAVVFASQNPPSVELARSHYKKALQLGVAKDPELEKLLKK